MLLESFTCDLVHSSQKWIQTILSCGEHRKTMQAGTVSRLRFCRRPWRLKINIRWTLVNVRKPHVQETDFSFTQFYRSWDYFSGCWCYAWTEFPRLIFVIWWLKYFIPHRTKSTNPKVRSHRETCRETQHSTWKTKIQPSTSIWIWIMLISFRVTWDLLNLALCCMAITKKKETGKLVATRNSENPVNSEAGSRRCPHHFHVTGSCTSHGEGLSDRTTNSRPKSNGWLEWPRREQRKMVYIHERHTSSRSSSWKDCFILVENIWRIYDLPRINSKVHNWLQRTYVEIDDSTMWQSFCDYEYQNLCLRRLGALSGKHE